jgi:PRTRC genetic system protein B
MNDLVTIQSDELPTWQLERAILVYEAVRENHFGMEERTGHAYATLHRVVRQKGAARLDAGVPATREACADLARALGANAALCGFLPPNLVYLGSRSMIWWRPPQRTRVFFDTTGQAAADQINDKTAAAVIGKRNGIVPHPGLVFAVAGSEWYVYALAATERPAPSAELLRAPYFNVWSSGEICTGNVRLPETLSAQTLGVYEKAFFDSEFTHPNLRGRDRLVDGNPYELWRELLTGSVADFPIAKLLSQKLTLQGLAKRLEKGGRGAIDE